MSFQNAIKAITDDLEADCQLILKSPVDKMNYHMLLKGYVKLLRTALASVETETLAVKNSVFPDHRSHIEAAKKKLREEKQQAGGGIILEAKDKADFENDSEPTKTFAIGGPFDKTYVDRPATMAFGKMIPIFGHIYVFGEDGNMHHNEEETRKYQAQNGGE